jgi:Flp pilus assembly pilin Flp
MSPRALLARLRRDSRGATILEFAFVAGPLVLMLLATFDLGYRIYMASVVQGTVQAGARLATIGNKTTEQIDAYVRTQLQAFSNTTVTITKKSYSDFNGVKQMEKITSDTAPIGTYNKGYINSSGTIVNGDCYSDVNNNWKRDDMGIVGLGNADDIVYYEVSVSFPRIVPMWILGWADRESVSANTVLRNQPYAARAAAIPPVRCYEK